MDLHKWLIQHVSYPHSLWRAGELGTLSHLREFERTQYLPPEELRALQWNRLRTVLDHAYQASPFYRERFERAGVIPSDLHGLEDLRALPPLEKSDIQANRDRMVAAGLSREALIANQTGGSTGTPISFFFSRDRKCARAAATVRHNRWAGWDVGDRVACIWGAARDRPPNAWRSRLRNALVERQLFIDTGCLTEGAIDRFQQALKRFRPKIILAYARSAVLVARYLKARGLTPYQPHSMVTSAEVLERDERALLEEVFGCPVFNRYGCREFSVVASECESHRGLHTMAESLYVEIEGDDGPARAGEPGAILVTDLLNLAMPMIRYRIGDIGSWETGECSCGRSLPRLREIGGRVTDFLVGSDGRLVSGVFIVTYLIAQRPRLGQVQIVQDTPGKVLFRIKPGQGFQPEEDFDYLTSHTCQYLGPETEVEFQVVPELRVEASGKMLVCRSTVKPTFLKVSDQESLAIR
jgi:phenylacetate-CoA ligase